MSIDAYTTAGLNLQFPSPVASTRDPTTSDIIAPSGSPYLAGQLWINTTLNKQWVYTGGGTWVLTGSGSSGAINSITGDSGGAEVPLLGNFNILGTADQVDTTGTANTLTISLIGPYTPATYTDHGVLVGSGATSITALAVGTTGQVLTGTTGADPAFADIGTDSGLTSSGVILGQNLGAFVATAVGTDGQTFIGVTGVDPEFADIGTRSGLTDHGLLIGQGAAAFVAAAVGTNGQVMLGSTGADPAFGTLTTTTGLAFTTGASSLAINVANGGYNINAASAGVALVAQNAYTVTQAGQASFSLPATSAVGTRISISSASTNAAGWIITQGAGQVIYANTNTTTGGAGGTLAGAVQCAVEIMCTVTDLEFVVVGGSGLTGLTFV